MNKVQLSVMDALLSGLDEKIDPDITMTIDNSRAPVVMSPIAVDDIAAGIFATFGGLAATLGKMKGLPAQSVLIDRRHSGNTLNSIAWHFQNTGINWTFHQFTLMSMDLSDRGRSACHL